MRFAFLKTSLCMLLLFFFSIAASAQTYTDVVHLKNGTVVRGIIIEQVPGKTLKVQTTDALKVEINYSDIEKISKETSITTKEAAITPGTSSNPSNTSVALKSGPKKYFFTAGAGFFTIDGIGYSGRVSVGMRLGKKFDLQAFYQLSEADKGLTRDATDEKYTRLSLQNYGVKSSFTISSANAVHPYFSMGAGYSRSPFTSSGRANDFAGRGYGYYSSFFFNPAFGLSIPIGKNTDFFTELNYTYHSWKDVFKPAMITDPKPYTHAQFAGLMVGVKF